jgi:hypothetical protein
MAEEKKSHGVRRLIPVPKFNDYHPDPTPAAIRYLVFTNKDGFCRCVVRRGRRVLIDEEQYFAWLDDQNKPAVKKDRRRYSH